MSLPEQKSMTLEDIEQDASVVLEWEITPETYGEIHEVILPSNHTIETLHYNNGILKLLLSCDPLSNDKTFYLRFVRDGDKRYGYQESRVGSYIDDFNQVILVLAGDKKLYQLLGYYDEEGIQTHLKEKRDEFR